jgi:hypothetical protein
MIKLNAMRFPIFVFIVCFSVLMIGYLPVVAQATAGEPVIISPRAGEAIQGRIEISGISAAEGFQRAEVEYRYVNDPKDSWFFIAETDQMVNPGKIAEWETSAVTDGNYDLRLTVCQKNGTCKSVLVRGIRVRNYSPIETATPPDPGKTPIMQVIVATTVPTRTPRPTQSVFQPNPAILTRSDLNSSLVRGGIVGLGFFLAFGIYWIIKRSLS